MKMIILGCRSKTMCVFPTLKNKLKTHNINLCQDKLQMQVV